MGAAQQTIDAYTLLCERCGYTIEGLPKQGACPECGTPIERSLPERRVGTAWQQERSYRSAAWTGVHSLFKPVSALDRMQPEIGNAKRGLLGAYALMAAIGVAIGPFVGACISVGAFGRGDWGIAGQFFAIILVVGGLIGAALTFPAVFILTSIESNGLRFIASRRKLRLTPAYARAVTSHGGIGWVLAFPSASVAVVGVLFSLAIAGVDATAWILLGSAGFVAGFLFFEVFAWLGLRRCKFANQVRAGSPAPLPTMAPGEGG